MKNETLPCNSISGGTAIFKCKNCKGEQLVSKPQQKPRATKGALTVREGNIPCDHCKRVSKVLVYENGTVRSSLLPVNKKQ